MSSENITEFHPRELTVQFFFNVYCDFFNVENQISLLDGRAYNHIQVLMFLYNDILTSDAYDDIDSNMSLEDKLELLDFRAMDAVLNGIGEYTGSITNTYKFVKKEIFNCIQTCDLLYEIINDTGAYFVDFIESYNEVMIEVNSRLISDMLIEFNNYLSHILKMLDECDSNSPNKKRAISHLHRGALDGYKYIIHSYADNPSFNNDLKQELVQLRATELKGIGKDENSKRELVKKYKDFTIKLRRVINSDFSETSSHLSEKDAIRTIFHEKTSK